MAKRFIDTATDTIWIVVAVNKQSTSVKMLQREPKHLMPNEYSYKLKIVTNFKYWEDRVKEYEMPEVNPPPSPSLKLQSTNYGKSIEQQVTEVLEGKS